MHLSGSPRSVSTGYLLSWEGAGFWGWAAGAVKASGDQGQGLHLRVLTSLSLMACFPHLFH